MEIRIPSNGFKFRVKNKKHSEQLQKTLFRYGFRWSLAKFTAQFVDEPFLYIYNSRFIMWDNDATVFKEHKAKKMTLNQFVNFMEGIGFGYTIYGEKVKKKNTKQKKWLLTNLQIL